MLVFIQKLLYEIIRILQKEERQNDITNLEKILKEIKDICKVKLNKDKNLINHLLKIIDRLSILYKNEESDMGV